jgi:hypothetical protein
MTDVPLSPAVSEEVEILVAALDSLIEGEAAAERLIAAGPQVIPYLEGFLLKGRPRTIALPRCRAVHALGELGAWPVLVEYFRQYRRPDDAVVLFAEDAVRSIAAQELGRWKSAEVYEVLLKAARERATGGLVRALSEFQRAESIPVLFSMLDDDLCRNDAEEALRKMPDPARAWAVLSLRGAAGPSTHLASAVRRRSATLQLLREFGVEPGEWPTLREFLDDRDADAVIATAGIGFAIGPPSDHPAIVRALFHISQHLNWAQEDEVIRLLDGHRDEACEQARGLIEAADAKGERTNWLVPRWRILRHLLGPETGAAAQR